MRAHVGKTIVMKVRLSNVCVSFVTDHFQARERFRQKEARQPAVVVAGGGIGSHEIVEDEDEDEAVSTEM